jgi:hypothetical protein
MGICSFGNEYTTENDAENLFIQIIYSFNTINDYSKRDILEAFSKVKSIQIENKGDQLEERETFISTNYDIFIKKFIDGSNSLANFHECLFPSFDELFDSYIQDKPEFNIMIFAISFLRDKNKFRVAAEIIEEVDNKKITLSSLLQFIKYYLDQVLTQITKRLVNKISELSNNTVINGTDYYIDDNFKSFAQKSLIRLDTNEYYTYISNHIRSILKKHKASNKEESIINDDEVDKLSLNKKQLELLNTELPFLFNTLDVRKDAWNFTKQLIF